MTPDNPFPEPRRTLFRFSLRSVYLQDKRGVLNWKALGVERPRSVKLGARPRLRLAHLSDIRDVASPSQAAQLGAELAGEPWLAADLLAVRPWLAADTPPREILSAILASEWSGLLALLGEYGPWVYAETVRDLQELGRTYSALVTAASGASETQVFEAATRQHAFPSLLARLEITDYRRAADNTSDLAALEQLLWQQLQQQARRHVCQR